MKMLHPTRGRCFSVLPGEPYIPSLKTRVADPGFFLPNLDPGLCTSNKGRFYKSFRMTILDDFKAFFFVFILFDAIDSGN